MKGTERAAMTSPSGVINEKDDDYEIIMLDQSPTQLALLIKEDAMPQPQVACKVSVHRVDHDGLIVKVVPPAEPVANETYSLMELVLLIDVSASMNDLAPVPPGGEGEESEQKGFTVLDLTKHAACTLVKSLNEHDTLCVVTFSTNCKGTNPFAHGHKPANAFLTGSLPGSSNE
jgi:hypothetical protein